MFVIPIGTDAPIYFWPITTIGLIVANCIVFAIQVSVGDAAEVYMLNFGTINPIQWVTSSFMHADIFHLVGNIIFLALFGLIVEGKIGWWKFLAIYLVCGTLSGMTMQILGINSTGVALGASDAIFAVMAIALFWAPENKIDMIGVFIVCFFIWPFRFSVPILMCGFFYIATDFFGAWMGFFGLSSAVAHLIGAVFGSILGYVTLARNWVDCEGYDLLSIMQGRRGEAPPLTEPQKQEQLMAAAKRQSDQRRLTEENKSKVARYIEQGHYELADMNFARLQSQDSSLRMPAEWRLRIIQGLSKNKSKNEKVISMMESYIREYTERRESVVLNLARLLVTEKQSPRKAIRYIRELDVNALDARQRELWSRIAERAKQMIDDGVAEAEG